ncbi:5-oxoprolinase subunit PxpB [Colidextribacter sp. OB.20]|uniref:5-oxoprolinase subunit PxpB n=1 Tax=Colidextribacter sp. OB.20 TaxID=2304568 RepID=UPI00136B8E92|nr:5-oxoprolinase subunit PxpB [Colidextribacter sp. OB.20]NBI11204.1 5-oxoprolinase subunit PxpB [Colidextribacter sp. OB.20]
MDTCRYLLVGDSAVTVEFSREILPETSQKIRALKEQIASARISGVLETVPAYCSLLVHYDPTVIQYGQLVEQLKKLQTGIVGKAFPPSVVMELPVCYDERFGPDLEYVARYHGITREEVISLHSSQDYLVYMLGFIAGFPYLGGMDERLATPRLETPRLCIEGGSVGIAGKQTGIYPVSSPGGWRLIGRTPLKLYDPTQEKIALLDAGCYIHFRPVELEEYRAIQRQVEENRYTCKTWLKEV